MTKKPISRRDFLRLTSLASAGAVLAACSPAATAAPPTAVPQVEQPTAIEVKKEEPTAEKPAEEPAVVEQPAATSEPINLTLWTYSGDEVMLAKMFEVYKAKHPNVNLNIVTNGLDDMVQKITTSLVAGAGLPDMADVEQGYFRKFAYAEGLLDLTPAGVEAHKDELKPWMWEAGLSPDKSKVLFLYYSIGVGVIHYRRSVFKKAGLPDDPDSVKALISDSWSANLETGTKIAKKEGPWMYDNASTVSWAYKEQYNPIWYDGASGTFQIDTPAKLEGVKIALDARKRGLDMKINAWTPEWNNTFKEGNVAIYPCGDWLVMNIQNYGGDSSKGDWGMAPLPGPTGATWGGSLLCAFAQTKYKAESSDVVSFLTFDMEAQLKQLPYYCFPSLIKSWDDPIMKEPVEWYGGQQTRLLVVEGAKNSSSRVYTAYDDQCSSIYGTEVANCLDQGKDPKQALADAQATAESQIEIKS